MKCKRISLWLVWGWCLASLFDTGLPHPHVYLCDPISGSFLVSLAISAAITAASVGLQYLTQKKQKGQNTDRGKQDDIRASVPGYGEFIPWGRGVFRIAPIWIWESPAVDHPVTSTVGGGGKFPKPPTNTTTDHAYYKSVAGVFHDGEIYGGVRRVWFDNDLVVDFRNDISATKYEAEYGVLSGGATVSTQAECSGGKKVTGIGSGGKCTVKVSTSGNDYELAVHYTSTTDLTYKVYIDGSLLGDLFCVASGSAAIVAIATYSLPITFTAGDHLIRLENSGAACPDLDCIDLALAQAPTVESRQFTSLIDVNKLPSTNQNHSWAYNNFLPDPGDGGGSGGDPGTPYHTFNLSKYGQPSIRIYRGTTTQEADSAIIAQEGVNFASAYRGWGYIVIDQIQLPGGRMPNVTLEVDQGVHSLPVIVSDIYERVGVSQLDVSALAGMTLGDADIDAGTYAAPTYANTANVTTGTGGAIHKSGGANHAWNAYAAGNASSASAVNASIRFTADVGPVLVGMGTDSSPTVTTDVIAGIVLNITSTDGTTRNAIQFAKAGVLGPDIGAWSLGDVFQFEIRNGRFRVYQNRIEIQGFTPAVPAYPLFPQIMMYDTGAGVSALSVSLTGAIGDAPNSDAGGILQASRMAAGDLLGALQTRFQFDMIEIDGVVRAVLRNRSTSDITIPYTDMRAVEVSSGSSPEFPEFDCSIADVDGYLLPNTVDVNYLDPSLDYHNNVQSWQSGISYRYDDQSVSLPVIDSADNMKALATTLGHKAEMEGRSFSFQTGWKYIHVAPGTIATLSLLNSTHTVRITQGKYPLPVGVCEFAGVRQAASLYTPTVNGSSSTGYEPPVAAIPQNTRCVIIDGPVLRPEDQGDGTEPIVYVAMCGRGSGAWQGGSLWQEFPIGSENYDFLTTASQQSQIGVSVGALATVTDPSIWDRVNSLVVNFYTPTELSSATEQDLRSNGSLNLLILTDPATQSWEAVQFKTAVAGVPVAPYRSTYTISVLLRGRIGSEGNVGTHVSGEDAVLVDSTLLPRRMKVSDIGR